MVLSPVPASSWGARSPRPQPSRGEGRQRCPGRKLPQEAPIGATLSTCARILAQRGQVSPPTEDRSSSHVCSPRVVMRYFAACLPQAGLGAHKTAGAAPAQMRKPRPREKSHRCGLQSDARNRTAPLPELCKEPQTARLGPLEAVWSSQRGGACGSWVMMHPVSLGLLFYIHADTLPQILLVPR